MFGKPRSPFAGKPWTSRRTGKDGSPVFRIEPRELTPLRARIADALTLAGTWAGMIGLMYETSHTIDVNGWMWLAAIAGPWIAYPLTKTWVRREFKKRGMIVMTTAEVRVRRGFGWRVFDRSIPHKFRLLPHDRAREEHEKHQLATQEQARKGRLIRKTRYYGESFHLSLDYLGQRNDIAVVFGRKEALRLRDRCDACDKVLSEWVRPGDGVALDPADQQAGTQPGDIPAN